MTALLSGSCDTNMLCHLVIALILPYIGLAEDPEQNKIIKVCDDPKVIAAGDDFFKCFKKDVKHILDANHEACNMGIYHRTIFQFTDIANATCYHNIHDYERDGLEFYKFMEYSMNYGTFKGFVNNGGLGCISAVKDNITKCVQDIVGTGPRDKYHTLWLQIGLNEEKQSCEETKRLQKCTLETMRNEGYYKCNYKTDVVLYVNSLFAFLLERCTRLVKAPEESPAPDSCSLTTHIVVGLLSVLITISLVYIVVRICRNVNGQWLKEQFKMTRRRESLVPNEVLSEN